MAAFPSLVPARDLLFVQSEGPLLAGRARFLYTTPNQNKFLSELLNLKQGNLHGPFAQGITFIQPTSYSQARQPKEKLEHWCAAPDCQKSSHTTFLFAIWHSVEMIVGHLKIPQKLLVSAFRNVIVFSGCHFAGFDPVYSPLEPWWLCESDLKTDLYFYFYKLCANQVCTSRSSSYFTFLPPSVLCALIIEHKIIKLLHCGPVLLL